MIVLCTGTPKAIHEDGRIVVSIPSGEDNIGVSLSINQALALTEFTARCAKEALRATPDEAPGARIIALPECLPSLVHRELKLREIVHAARVAAPQPRAKRPPRR